jgi:hypothetical protein
LQTITEAKSDSNLTTDESSKFYNSIASIPSQVKFEERITDYKVQIDGTLAHVWTPYQFYINGNLSHSGVNSFTLFKENESWKIIHIIDTRRK